MPYVAKGRLENEKKLIEEVRKCHKKIRFLQEKVVVRHARKEIPK